jgi:hypothetical protein
MPEFEEDNPTTSQSQNYTPSTDASQKPRTRRRSGGFKTEVVSLKNAKIGEVNAAEAIKEEKLSGQASPAAEPRREPRAEREPRAPRRETNPLPSPETLAAITRVEARLIERRTERDARRTERDKNRPARTDGKPGSPRSGARKSAASTKKSKGGLLAAISGFFGKLFGNEPETTLKKSDKRSRQGRGGRPQGKGGKREGQNRGRGGHGRKRGGNRGGPRRNDRRTNENVSS